MGGILRQLPNPRTSVGSLGADRRRPLRFPGRVLSAGSWTLRCPHLSAGVRLLSEQAAGRPPSRRLRPDTALSSSSGDRSSSERPSGSWTAAAAPEPSPTVIRPRHGRRHGHRVGVRGGRLCHTGGVVADTPDSAVDLGRRAGAAGSVGRRSITETRRRGTGPSGGGNGRPPVTLRGRDRPGGAGACHITFDPAETGRCRSHSLRYGWHHRPETA